MSWTLTTSNAATAKAGSNANSTVSVSNAAMGKWSADAEGAIEVATHIAWVDSYATLSTGIKAIISDVCSSMIAMNIIAYDTTGYLAREADTLMNNNDLIITRGIASLRDFKNSTLRTP